MRTLRKQQDLVHVVSQTSGRSGRSHLHRLLLCSHYSFPLPAEASEASRTVSELKGNRMAWAIPILILVSYVALVVTYVALGLRQLYADVHDQVDRSRHDLEEVLRKHVKKLLDAGSAEEVEKRSKTADLTARRVVAKIEDHPAAHWVREMLQRSHPSSKMFSD